jgi:putative ABC transport system ATP-binding protein
MSDTVYLLRDVRRVREKGGCYFELRIPSLNIGRREFIAVVGPSGCGKSTLLDLLAFVLRPTSFRYFCFGEETTDSTMVNIGDISPRDLAGIRKSSIGYVLQSGGLLPFLSVKDNILLPSRLNALPGATRRALALARVLGIEDQLGKKPMHLSGGQRQRVAIARAIAHGPAVVLADEPTAAVDELTAKDIMDTFKELARKMGITIILVTHSRDLAASTADRLFTFQIKRDNGKQIYSTLCEGEIA